MAIKDFIREDKNGIPTIRVRAKSSFHLVPNYVRSEVENAGSGKATALLPIWQMEDIIPIKEGDEFVVCFPWGMETPSFTAFRVNADGTVSDNIVFYDYDGPEDYSELDETFSEEAWEFIDIAESSA